jgi:hypothetical protein
MLCKTQRPHSRFLHLQVSYSTFYATDGETYTFVPAP